MACLNLFSAIETASGMPVGKKGLWTSNIKYKLTSQLHELKCQICANKS
jgi:hypothetical protein